MATDPRMDPMDRTGRGGMSGQPGMAGGMAGGMGGGMGGQMGGQMGGGMGGQMAGGMAGGQMGPAGQMSGGQMAGGMAGMGPAGTGPMDHHRSTSMPANMGPQGQPGMGQPGMGQPGMQPGQQGGMMHSRSRSANRGMPGNRGPGYHSLDRAGEYAGDRDFMPIREPRERSLDRDFAYGGAGGYGAGQAGAAGYGTGGAGAYGRRDRSLDRRDMLDPALEDPYFASSGAGVRGDPMMRGDPMVTARRAGLSPNPAMLGAGPMAPAHSAVSGQRDMYIGELQSSNSELQRDLGNLRKELELTNQKLGSSMHSIKTFWSPELKKERALRKEESAKYSLINDQLKLLNSENQVSPITSHKPIISIPSSIKPTHAPRPAAARGQSAGSKAAKCSVVQRSAAQFRQPLLPCRRRRHCAIFLVMRMPLFV